MISWTSGRPPCIDDGLRWLAGQPSVFSTAKWASQELWGRGFGILYALLMSSSLRRREGAGLQLPGEQERAPQDWTSRHSCPAGLCEVVSQLMNELHWFNPMVDMMRSQVRILNRVSPKVFQMLQSSHPSTHILSVVTWRVVLDDEACRRVGKKTRPLDEMAVEAQVHGNVTVPIAIQVLLPKEQNPTKRVNSMQLRLPQGVLPATLYPGDHAEIQGLRDRVPADLVQQPQGEEDWRALIDYVLDPRMAGVDSPSLRRDKTLKCLSSISGYKELVGTMLVPMMADDTSVPVLERHGHGEAHPGMICAADAPYWLEAHLASQDKKVLLLVYGVEETLGPLHVFPTVSGTVIYNLARDPILRFLYHKRREYATKRLRLEPTVVEIAIANREHIVPPLHSVYAALGLKEGEKRNREAMMDPSVTFKNIMIHTLFEVVQRYRGMNSEFLYYITPVVPTMNLMKRASWAGAHRIPGGIVPRGRRMFGPKLNYWILRSSCHSGCEHDPAPASAGMLPRPLMYDQVLHPEDVEMRPTGVSSAQWY